MPNDRPNITLKEIAERLGLNVGTVSRALSGSPKVAAATRELVVNMAAELKYRPNKSAQHLIRGKPSNSFIAVLMPNIVHQFFLSVLKGIINELDEASFNVMILNLRGNRKNVIDLVLDEAPDGLLVFAKEMAADECQAIARRRIPYLYVDYFSQKDPCVYFDNYLGGQIAARYLLEKNVRSPLYIGLTAQSQQQELRFRGFSDSLTAGGIDSFEARYIPRDENLAADITKEVLESGRFDGIFYFCDELAYGGLRAGKESGIRVPMLGYDDLHISDLLGLTTIRQDGEAMGRRSARSIVDMINDAQWSSGLRKSELESSHIQIKLEPRLIVRSS
ncbi:MAG TPA: LacI family DNA-binding transcriptional regulator [Rectinemataceae bacterium]